MVFRHAKVRESVYEMIPSFRRSEYHRKAAEILSRSYSPQTWNPALSSMICYHCTKAGLLKNVLNQHLQGLADLQSRLSPEEVRALIERYCDAVLHMAKALAFEGSDQRDLVPVLRSAWKATRRRVS